jgi:ribosomal protein S27E
MATTNKLKIQTRAPDEDASNVFCKLMPRQRRYDVVAIRASLDTECPGCHKMISPKDIIHPSGDWMEVRCPGCGHTFRLEQVGNRCSTS